MNLICDFWENPNVQCCVIEDDVQCNRGSRILYRRLCNKHYSRWKRTGSVYKTTRAEVVRQQKEAKRIEEGLSVVCLCTHSYMQHKHNSKVDSPCRIHGCRCTEFIGTNEELVMNAVRKLNRIGFVPLNESALCQRCNVFLDIGPWYDHYAIGRAREHLRAEHLVRRDKTA